LGTLIISLLCLACIFCGALVGLFIRRVLPEHHLSETTWDSIKIGTGLIATLTALVLGLLVNSAKDNFDMINAEIIRAGANIILLDRLLIRYGSEAQDVRKELRGCIASGLELLLRPGSGQRSGINAFERREGIEQIHDMLRKLAPSTEYHRSILAQALGIMAELTKARWLTLEQLQGGLPAPFLIIMVVWLTVFFICFGLLSEANMTVVTVMLVCAVSVAGAIFLILEMNNPVQGIIRVSLEPLHYALAIIGR